ncbi:winged helix DNA-binding domain-containing protein [Isoptericola cucumis]|uniref:winged helix DNA-binding domain-containing protein n=1 Tax=Isoptericola cucumis TaxID=1776856 RepID=UPI00320827A9
MAAEVSRRDVVAFRLGAHHLLERASGDEPGSTGLLDTAGRCGIQDSPPGSALLALHARVAGVTRERVDTAVAEDKALLRTWSLRGAPYVVPTRDAPVFTTGVLPPTEEAMRQVVLGAGPSLDRLGMSLTETVGLCRAEVADVLHGRRLDVGELGAGLAARVAARLPPARRAVWDEEGPYAAGQPLGEGVVHFCLRILALQGVICFAPRSGNRSPFVLVSEWLGRALPGARPEDARAELLRRYLRCYGPSTRADFAAWVGVRAGDVGPWWDLVADELEPVGVDGRAAWARAVDLDALRSAPMPRGVRLLPPGDPYTQARDRGTIVEASRHRDVWRTVGSPGTVLVDGEIAGTWRPRKSGRRLTVSVATFGGLRERDAAALRAEADQVATLRGASSAVVEIDDA